MAKEILPTELMFFNTETLLSIPFVVTRSALPSPFMSLMETQIGYLPVGNAILGAKEILPGVLKFLETVTVFEPKLVAARSGFPSPSRSPIETINGPAIVARSSFEAKEILPPVLVFLITDNDWLAPWVMIARSGFPSPSRSLIATL